MKVVWERDPDRALAAKPYKNPPRHAVETTYQVNTEIGSRESWKKYQDIDETSLWCISAFGTLRACDRLIFLGILS